MLHLLLLTKYGCSKRVRERERVGGLSCCVRVLSIVQMVLGVYCVAPLVTLTELLAHCRTGLAGWCRVDKITNGDIKNNRIESDLRVALVRLFNQ